MQIRRLLLPILAASILLAFAIGEAKGNSPGVMYVSPSGAYQVEQASRGEGAAWVVSTSNPKQRAKVPTRGEHVEGEPAETEDEFHFSPDDEWIFGLHHVGSGLRDGDLFHRAGPAKIESVAEAGDFSAEAWAKAVKLGAMKRDFAKEGLYAMTFFQGWSGDSSRLLVQLGGGDTKQSFQYAWIYFNTQTKRFELTDYLRKLNKLKSPPAACAEPVAALPEEAELKKRFDEADQKLNKVYQETLAREPKDQTANQREYQRKWIKDRDAGLAIYLTMSTPDEKERRRLYFMASVTQARIEELRWTGE